MSVFLAAAALLIHNVTVIDPASRAVRANADVCVAGERIADSCDGAAVIDGSGKYLIPGLVDMHVHLLAHPWTEQGYLKNRYDRGTVEQMLRTFLDFGVTSVRDAGSESEAAVVFRAMVQNGTLEGPDITTCGRILESGTFDPEPFAIVNSAAEVRREIRWQKAVGVDCIKLYADMPSDLVAVAIDEAHKNGLPVTGHLQRTSWTQAARLGIDGVEHSAPWSRQYVAVADRGAYVESLLGRIYWLEHLDEKAVDEMVADLVKHHVVVDPTLMAIHTKWFGDDPRWTENPDNALAPPLIVRGWRAFTYTKEWTPEQYRAARATWPTVLRLTKKLFDAGVPLVAGTDTPTPWIVPGASLHDEMRLLRDAGIPAMDVLRIATRGAAIQPGAQADLVLLAKNPLDDITYTRSIVNVIKRGAVVK